MLGAIPATSHRGLVSHGSSPQHCGSGVESRRETEHKETQITTKRKPVVTTERNHKGCGAWFHLNRPRGQRLPPALASTVNGTGSCLPVTGQSQLCLPCWPSARRDDALHSRSVSTFLRVADPVSKGEGDTYAFRCMDTSTGGAGEGRAGGSTGGRGLGSAPVGLTAFACRPLRWGTTPQGSVPLRKRETAGGSLRVGGS